MEYDVHRNETAALQQSNASPEAVADADFRCNQHRRKYEQLKADVKVLFSSLDFISNSFVRAGIELRKIMFGAVS